MLTLLHVGCGGDPMPEWAVGHFVETRLDISPDNSPDIVASMADMGNIGPFDAVFCSHALEHLVAHEADKALREFRRVLKPGGFAIIVVPDLEGVSATDEVLYTAPCGPVTGLDMIYGKQSLLPTMPHMAHRTGFVADTMKAAIERAGMKVSRVQRVPDYNLLAVAQA